MGWFKLIGLLILSVPFLGAATLSHQNFLKWKKWKSTEDLFFTYATGVISTVTGIAMLGVIVSLF